MSSFRKKFRRSAEWTDGLKSRQSRMNDKMTSIRLLRHLYVATIVCTITGRGGDLTTKLTVPLWKSLVYFFVCAVYLILLWNQPVTFSYCLNYFYLHNSLFSGCWHCLGVG